jgi:hypothetical protein
MHEELRRTGVQDRVSDVSQILQIEIEGRIEQPTQEDTHGRTRRKVSVPLGALQKFHWATRQVSRKDFADMCSRSLMVAKNDAVIFAPSDRTASGSFPRINLKALTVTTQFCSDLI